MSSQGFLWLSLGKQSLHHFHSKYFTYDTVHQESIRVTVLVGMPEHTLGTPKQSSLGPQGQWDGIELRRREKLLCLTHHPEVMAYCAQQFGSVNILLS